MLNHLGQQHAECQCPFHEFMYLVAWLGCQRVGVLDVERDKIDDLLIKGDMQ